MRSEVCTFDISRYPFDNQTCEIDLILTDYASSEVQWNVLDGITTSLYKDNPMWTFTGVEDKVIVTELSYPIGNSIQILNKSHYILEVELTRNPRTGILYVIIPTVIISIFNNFAYIVPMEGGINHLLFKFHIS